MATLQQGCGQELWAEEGFVLQGACGADNLGLVPDSTLS